MKIVPEFLLRHDLRLFVFVSTPTIDIEPFFNTVSRLPVQAFFFNYSPSRVLANMK